MLYLLQSFDTVCKKHDIDYWLDYGTLLGAIRHQGFIPWDTDTDVGMLRSDYGVFLEKGVPELPQDIFFIDVINHFITPTRQPLPEFAFPPPGETFYNLHNNGSDKYRILTEPETPLLQIVQYPDIPPHPAANEYGSHSNSVQNCSTKHSHTYHPNHR